MSITTKTGDAGMTGLMYNRRVPKHHPRVEAFGTVDELNAALGVARAALPAGPPRDYLLTIQKDLVVVMGELATAVEDLPRFVGDGYRVVQPEMAGRLETAIQQLESGGTEFRGWAMPGESVPAAALDMARTVCRRAERQLCRLHEAEQLKNPQMIVYLNRLSDLLWLLARGQE